MESGNFLEILKLLYAMGIEQNMCASAQGSQSQDDENLESLDT